MHDGGTRQSFSTGAVRDTAEGKPRPDLFSPFAEERVGEWLRLGAQKYSEHNWAKGIPNSRCFASLRRHVMRYQQSDRSEDHLAAVIFNAMAIIHNEEMIGRGVLPAELDDMPEYGPNAAESSHKCHCPPENGHNSPLSSENSHKCHCSSENSHKSPLSADISHNPPISADISHISVDNAENVA